MLYTLTGDHKVAYTTELNDRQYATKAKLTKLKRHLANRTLVQVRQADKENVQLPFSSISKAAAYTHWSGSESKDEKRTRSSKARARV